MVIVCEVQCVSLQVCEYALLMSNGNTELVSMEVRKQLICTCVTVKQLLQQQIGLELDICDQVCVECFYMTSDLCMNNTFHSITTNDESE